ncbi:MAG: hypothetical protein IAF02_22175 [Anaerolineae bacterium]|nr:hypothetical protein [Anaerolineae bacterium]
MKSKKSEGLVGGLILIGIGLVALLAQFVDFISWESFGIYFVLLLGVVFYIWGILGREAGLMIPGGILTGIGAGIVVLVNNLIPAGIEEGGLFLVIFGLGWASITVMTAVFTHETQWWPLIPGGIIGFVGLAVMFGGVFMNLLKTVAVFWPVILIIVGLAVIWQARKPREKSPREL